MEREYAQLHRALVAARGEARDCSTRTNPGSTRPLRARKGGWRSSGRGSWTSEKRLAEAQRDVSLHGRRCTGWKRRMPWRRSGSRPSGRTPSASRREQEELRADLLRLRGGEGGPEAAHRGPAAARGIDRARISSERQAALDGIRDAAGREEGGTPVAQREDDRPGPRHRRAADGTRPEERDGRRTSPAASSHATEENRGVRRGDRAPRWRHRGSDGAGPAAPAPVRRSGSDAITTPKTRRKELDGDDWRRSARRTSRTAERAGEEIRPGRFPERARRNAAKGLSEGVRYLSSLGPLEAVAQPDRGRCRPRRRALPYRHRSRARRICRPDRRGHGAEAGAGDRAPEGGSAREGDVRLPRPDAATSDRTSPASPHPGRRRVGGGSREVRRGVRPAVPAHPGPGAHRRECRRGRGASARRIPGRPLRDARRRDPRRASGSRGAGAGGRTRGG